MSILLNDTVWTQSYFSCLLRYIALVVTFTLQSLLRYIALVVTFTLQCLLRYDTRLINTVGNPAERHMLRWL